MIITHNPNITPKFRVERLHYTKRKGYWWEDEGVQFDSVAKAEEYVKSQSYIIYKDTCNKFTIRMDYFIEHIDYDK